MKKKISDIRIKKRDEQDINNVSVSSSSRALDGNSVSLKRERFFNSFDKLKNNIDDFSNTKEILNPDRRNMLKIVAASGGVLIAGSILQKFSSMSSLSLSGNSNNILGSIFSPKNKEGDLKQDSDDLNSFFENFRIVKNDKEYILYNKEGDNILIIDRDA